MEALFPERLRQQLTSFRQRVWRLKTLEAISRCVVMAVVSFFVVFGLDRIWEAPQAVRTLACGALILATMLIPIAIYRWVWRRRTLPQVSQLIARQMPEAGDRLLGAIELVQAKGEQARSPELCRAAIAQVDADAQQWNLTDALPPSRIRIWQAVAVLGLIGAGVTIAAVPDAAKNAWLRLLAPWSDVPRYTFARVEPLPDPVILPHGEPFQLEVALADNTSSRPASASLHGKAGQLESPLAEANYSFDVPPQTAPGTFRLLVGDLRQPVELAPTLRPELSALSAEVTLPNYLQRTEPVVVDARGGQVSVVRDAMLSLLATTSRELASASVNQIEQPLTGSRFKSEPIAVDKSHSLTIRWEDKLGLVGKQPFQLHVKQIEDEEPLITCLGLKRQQVVLDSQQLRFDVQAHDDFGVRAVGYEWQELSYGEPLPEEPTSAEGKQRVLAAGNPTAQSMQVDGTFTASQVGISGKPILLRVYAEDYHPDHPRSYSPPYLLYVLTPDQHAIWMTEQLSRWHRQALQIRDRELRLYEENKRLRDLPVTELNDPDVRRQIEEQARAEATNGRSLARLTKGGDALVKQASRNTEIGVGHLEKWAEMLQLLKEVAGNRMPSVANLLQDAADSPQLVARANSQTKPNRQIGTNRKTTSGSGSESQNERDKKQQSLPQIVDRESSQQPADGESKPGNKKKPSSPTLRLPVTTLAGNGKAGDQQADKPKADEAMEEAVTEQKDLLAELDKIADELNTVLANLEGSTLVKRLKAASRQQNKIAGEISAVLDASFGRSGSSVPREQRSTLDKLTSQQKTSSEDVSYIMDDLQAYFARRPLAKFSTVLTQMKEHDVVGNLRTLGPSIASDHGLSMAECEFWSDSLDRWAEDLVDPACKGTCPGCKSRGSLPPSIILAALQILEGEMNLREDTRIAEKARPAETDDQHTATTQALATVQDDLRVKTDDVIKRIEELPEASLLFGKEIRLLQAVSRVMSEAHGLLQSEDTGAATIAAETEAIELLLQSKRINPNGGGGGGSSPGGGGGGDTNDSALALVGSGVNAKEVRKARDVSQATGQTGSDIPEEFRAGLDEYFNRLLDSDG